MEKLSVTGDGLLQEITETLEKPDGMDKGLRVEDAFLANYLLKLGKWLEDNAPEGSRSKSSLGLALTIEQVKDPAKTNVKFTFSYDIQGIEENLGHILGEAYSAYLRILGMELIKKPTGIEVRLDNDLMASGASYVITLEAPHTLKCQWRKE